MRKLFLIAVVATALLLDNGVASALHRRGGCSSGCGGERHHRVRHHGGCNTCAPAACAGCAAGCAASGLGATCGAAVCLAGDAVADTLVEATVDSTSVTLVVDLPEDATLTVNGSATTSTSSSRVYMTSGLEAGKSYQYTLTAQVTRDGVQQTVTRQVTVRTGEETRVSLEMPTAAVVAR